MISKMEISLLYDFYGALLPASQQKVVELCVNEDLSLSEVASQLSISRQGVRDALSRASKKLSAFEEQLKMLESFRKRQKTLERIIALCDEIENNQNETDTTSLAAEIKTLAGEMMDTEE